MLISYFGRCIGKVCCHGIYMLEIRVFLKPEADWQISILLMPLLALFARNQTLLIEYAPSGHQIYHSYLDWMVSVVVAEIYLVYSTLLSYKVISCLEGQKSITVTRRFTWLNCCAYPISSRSELCLQVSLQKNSFPISLFFCLSFNFKISKISFDPYFGSSTLM